MEHVNLADEMSKIFNTVTVDDVDIDHPAFEQAKKAIGEYGFREKILAQTTDLCQDVAKASKIALTGKSGFKDLNEFYYFVSSFPSAIEALKGMEMRLFDVMTTQVKNSGSAGEKFMKERKKEAATILAEQLKNIIKESE